jgi:hypothetical protein
MRLIWKGSISFGLVNVPVGLAPAVAYEELKFRMLRASDLSPINFKRVAEAIGKEIPWSASWPNVPTLGTSRAAEAGPGSSAGFRPSRSL